MTPIEDYGLLGDTRTAALVSSDGAIDWLCTPRFDSDPIFGRLVGGPAAGTFRIAPARPATTVTRGYQRHSATVETTWTVGERRLTLTDAMVAEVAGRLLPATLLVRRLVADGGPVDVDVDFDPRLGEHHRPPATRRRGRNLVCTWGPLAVSLGCTPDHGIDVGQPAPVTVTPDQPLARSMVRDKSKVVMMTDSKTDEHGALFVTASSEDPRFNQPYVDVRSWRDEPADAPVFPGAITTQHGGAAPVKARHLYVHGGFTGTDAKFSFCFPPEEEYQGRFFQATHQLFAGEEATPRNIAFALTSGGYSVQTNMGGSDNPRTAEASARGQSDTTIRGYRVNAEAAKFSRVVAAEVYGPHRTYGYLYGGSGGAYQTVTSAEMTTGVWDGFVPYVMGSPQSIPNCFTVRVNALRVLKDKWPSIIDAIEPGGSGEPYAGLNDEERAALEEATRTGFPPRAWFNYVPQGGGPLVLVANYVPVLDPTYLADFWTKPGYLGTDATSSVRAARIQHEATVVDVVPGRRKQLKLSSVPTGDLTAADVIITSGAAAGKTASLGRVASDGRGQVGLVFESVGDTIDITADPTVVECIEAGDEVRIDNSRFLALQTYHRHQFPPANPDFDYPDVYDYFRNPDGTPKYPQRGVDIGAAGTLGSTGQIPTGRFNGKMIMVECLLDGDALPWQADWYRQKVAAVEGPQIDDKYRLWYVDNANHTDPTTETQQTHAVAYSGTVQYALRELSAWVEQAIVPPPTSGYRVQDGQVHVPASAAQRKGIQPVIHLEVNGAERADVAVGEAVTFIAQIEVPPAPGKVVSAKWDFEGVGAYPDAAELGDPTSETLHVTTTHAFSKPGTYFPTLRVASQREGNPSTPFARSLNLSRVRVVVNE